MSLLDLVLVVLIVLAVIGGYRLGFIARVVSWFGLAAGLVIAVRILPAFLRQLGDTNHGLVLVLTIGLLLVGASLGQAVGFMIGGRITPRRIPGGLGMADRILGAVAGFVGVVVLIWLVIPLFISTPGRLATETTNSWIARSIDNTFPPAPDAMQALRSVLGTDAFPEVFDALQPTPELGPPPVGSGLDLTTAASVARSVVKIEGPACSRIQDGSGFVVSDGLIATNAHVVAGERSTTVIRDDDRRFDARVVSFDPDRDLAILSVSDFDRPALPVSNIDPRDGTVGGVFGHPGGEPLRIAPFQIARTINATGRDIYGGARTDRRVLEIASALRPGDSGSALVDPSGTVQGVAFAIARDRSDVAYALAPSELRAVLADVSPTAVPTGPCLD